MRTLPAELTEEEVRQIVKQRIELISKIIARSFETGVALEAMEECDRAFWIYQDTKPMLKQLLKKGE